MNTRDGQAPWSEDLELLHRESSRTHFLDVWTRTAVTDRLGQIDPGETVLEVGCSTGYMLEHNHRLHPGARLVGFDIVFSGLREARAELPFASLAQADARHLPCRSQSVDVVVSINLLEHVPDDSGALREFFRVLKPGGCAVLVVPAGRALYDYYDRYLGHQRRYSRGELADKAQKAGFTVRDDLHLGSLIYPAFWLVKKRNRLLHDELSDGALQERVSHDIATTKDSALGRATTRLERWLLRFVRLPFGVRELVVVRRDG